jgi:hypothetical protein
MPPGTATCEGRAEFTELRLAPGRLPGGELDLGSAMANQAALDRGGCFRSRKRSTRSRLTGGGAVGDRTPDLLIANEALSQLSYGPETGSGQP